jgi:predicted signal transduction protein with EAL and GGDEF domain
LLAALTESVTLNGRAVTISGSIGIAISDFDFDEPDSTSLLYAADLAMYEAKRGADVTPATSRRCTTRRWSASTPSRPSSAPLQASRCAVGLGSSLLLKASRPQDQLDRLVELGCDRAQGYFLGRPVDAASIAAALDQAMVEALLGTT